MQTTEEYINDLCTRIANIEKKADQDVILVNNLTAWLHGENSRNEQNELNGDNSHDNSNYNSNDSRD